MSSTASYSSAPERARRRDRTEPHAFTSRRLLSLLEGVGLAEDPTVSKFTPYLRASTTLTGGGKSLGGGIERLRLVLGLQHAAG